MPNKILLLQVTNVLSSISFDKSNLVRRKRTVLLGENGAIKLNQDKNSIRQTILTVLTWK